MNRRLIALLVLFLLPLTAGCWDIEEVDDRAQANVIFFDTGNLEKFKIGAAIHIPGTVVPPIVGTAQQLQKRHYSVTAEGSGLLDAWSELQTNMIRNLFFSHLGAIIISDSFAKGDINNLLDFISRRAVVPLNVNLLVAKYDPARLIEMNNNSNVPPGNYISTFFRAETKHNMALPMSLWEVNKALDNKTMDPFMPLIDEAQGNYKIAGVALFSQNRKVGELSTDETKALALLRGATAGYLSIPYDNGEKLIAFSNVSSKSKTELHIEKNGDLIFEVTTRITGSVGEIIPRKTRITSADRKYYEGIARDFTEQEIKSLIKKLQELNSDPVGFGGQVRLKFPKLWEKIDWHQVYPTATFKVKTEFKIDTTGILR